MANEKRLIDANALAKDLELLAKHEDSFRQSVILGVVHTVNAQPTVDAVEVGRCKGCYYYESRNPGHGYCKYFDTLRIDNDYCSSWERKSNG